MWFLAFNLLKPDTWLSSTAPAVMGTILNGIRTLLFDITITVYKFVVLVYSLFEKLCSARLLSNEILRTMASRVGLILGLIMFFYVIFSLIQMLIDPGKITDKENGAIGIVKKSVLVIFMLGISNFGFELLYDVQNKIIQSDVISRLILPYSVKSDDKARFGNMLSFQLMKAFYQIDDITPSTDDGAEKKRICGVLTEKFFDKIYFDNNYNFGYMCLNESVEVDSGAPISNGGNVSDEAYLIDFNGIFAIAAGAFVVYMLLMYCFKIGVRMIQLALLEIISPMAIISYLSPKKDNMLTRWWKVYFSTYIDVFIRIAIINFVIFLICTIFSTNENFIFWESLGYISSGEKLFFTVVIILALLTFAKKAPDLLKELLPNAGKGLGFGLGMKDIIGLKHATGIVGGALGGAAIGLLGGGIGGTIGGLLKGGLSGLKGQGFGKTAASAWKAQQASNKRIRDWRAAGGGPLPFGRWAAAFNQWRGADTAADIDERVYDEAKGYTDSFSQAKSEAQSEVLKHSGNYQIAMVDSSGVTQRYSLGQLDKMRNSDAYTAAEQDAYEKKYQELLKNATEHALSNNGAIDSGSGVLWDTTGTMHDLGGNTIDTNSTIQYNMDYVLGSSGATHTGDRAKDAKAANKYYSDTKARHSTDTRVKRNKADSKYSGRK